MGFSLGFTASVKGQRTVSPKMWTEDSVVRTEDSTLRTEDSITKDVRTAPQIACAHGTVDTP